MNTIIGTSPKRARKPQMRSLLLRQAIIAIAGEYDRMSVRQLFYQLVSRGVIDKTEAAYKRVSDCAVQMRLGGSLDYRKITDGHRERRMAPVYGDLREAMQEAHEFYRKDYWRNQSRAIEVWCEKDALSGVIQPICNRYGVTYVATRGFPSLTLRYESAMNIVESGKPTTILYFGDHDASGRQISDNLEGELSHHGADVTVNRIALEPWEIRAYDLPTRPGKTSDSRHARFADRYGTASVELDALPPNVLTEMVEAEIEARIDWESWGEAQHVERLERVTLESLALMARRVRAGAIIRLDTEEESA